MAAPILRKFGAATTIPFSLLEIDGVDLRIDAVFATGDVKITKDEGIETNIITGFVDEGSKYSIALSATEMQAARISLILIDQTATKVWLDTTIEIETYGDVNAQHAFDLDTAFVTLASTGLDQITQAATGIIEIAKAIWDRTLTGATHNIGNSAGRRLRNLQEFGTYEGGAVWIDTVNGTTGTTIFENGTVFNPSLTLADAITLAADPKVNLKKFQVTPGSIITFAEAHTSEVWIGSNWILNLGGQDISNTRIESATVSGISTGTGTQFLFDCITEGVTWPDNTHLVECGIGGAQTLPAGDIFYDRCHNGLPGGIAPIFDFGVAVLNTTLNLLQYDGSIEIQNLGQTGTDIADIVGNGSIIINANSIGGTITITGNWDLTNNGTPTITDGARYNQSKILSDATPFAGADIAAVKVKTDKLTFTSGNDLDANIQKVNDTVVIGDGKATTEWGS